MVNITTGNEHNAFKSEESQCINESSIPASVSIFLACLNFFLSIITLLGNSLILTALYRVTSIHPPTKHWFRCLAVSDLFTGLFSQIFIAIAFIICRIANKSSISFLLIHLASCSSLTLRTVSTLTSTAISVDRLLGLLLGLRYRHVVTLNRVRAIIICFWLLSVALGAWRFISRDHGPVRATALALMLISLLTSVFCYIKIYLLLHHHQRQVQAQQLQLSNGGVIPLNIARYREMVSSIAWIQITTLICYLPFSVASILFIQRKLSGEVFRMIALIIFLDSSLNPILYCWRIKDVREAVKDMISRCF